jgi:hypothetical protein
MSSLLLQPHTTEDRRSVLEDVPTKDRIMKSGIEGGLQDSTNMALQLDSEENTNIAASAGMNLMNDAHEDASAPSRQLPSPPDKSPKDNIHCEVAQVSHDALTPEAVERQVATIVSRLNGFSELLEPPNLSEPLQDDTGEDSDDSDFADMHTFRGRRALGDVMWYIGRSREEFGLAAMARKKRQKLKKAAAAKDVTLDDIKLSSLEALSSIAYMKGEVAKMCWMDWMNFLSPKGSYEDSVAFPLTAVIGEPEPQIILPLHSVSSTAQTKAASVNRRIERPSAPSGNPGQIALPERLKIHSGPLYRILRTLMDARPNWQISVEDASLVFLRPYKEFIYYEEQLKDCLAKLEKRAEGFKVIDGTLDTSLEVVKPTTEAGNKTADPNDAGDDTQPSAEKTRHDNGVEDDKASESNVLTEENENGQNPVTSLLHLRCLVKFLDDEVKLKTQYINSDKCVKILFHDLWHLFKPGNEILDQREKQAYRVVRVEIPRHKVEDPWVRWTYSKRRKPNDSSDEELEEDTPFKVHCAYIDFDGKQFGPVSFKFAIQPYGGMKDIKSLPVYPLRFAKDVKFREKLIERGKMLLDVAKFRPM